ncbi:hypothetical protein [Crocosphaera sp.]|uniref:hypothetical protein n=1 Tax=Crocosphaera sp. TaxID=2729996 RepID=UPI003F226AD0|nr:hypothetical protein [Crocosphaera sp.]
MSLPFFDKNREQINNNLEQQYQNYKDTFNRIFEEARPRYKMANFWSQLHLFFGFLASITSLMSLILTLSNNTHLIIITSSISAISASILTVFNPSMRAAKLLALKEVSQITNIEIISLDAKFKNSTQIEEKIILLETFNERLQQIIKKLNEPY